MRCKLKQEYEVARYDGSKDGITLIGAFDEKGVVQPRTAPQWLDAIAAIEETPGAAKARAMQEGILTQTEDGSQLYIPCRINRCVHRALPGDYIIRGVKGEILVANAGKFKEKYEVC